MGFFMQIPQNVVTNNNKVYPLIKQSKTIYL